MRRLTSASIGAGWSGTLLAVQAAADLALAAVPGAAGRGADARYEELSWEVSRQLGEGALELYQAGDSLQRDAADLLLPGSPWDLGGWLRSAPVAAGLAGESCRFATPTAAGLDAWRELANKVQVYRLVKQVAGKIGVPPADRPFDLQALVERCYRLDEYSALWAVEGLGHDYALRFWPSIAEPPDGLLTGPRATELPAKSLTMLHAGIGLAFADRLLAALPPEAPPERTAATVVEILRICRSNSLPGYLGAAIESLGLVTRTYHRERTGEIDTVLRVAGEEAARQLYWHGVGRALYFLPLNFLPIGDTTWRPFAMGIDLAPDPAARRNALAGLGWAFTLVNMRQPDLIVRLLLAPRAEALAAEPGFPNGVASSIVMRTDTTPGSPLVESFLAHAPQPADAAAWDALVASPARRALAEEYPRLLRRGELGEIFRFQPAIGCGAGGAA